MKYFTRTLISAAVIAFSSQAFAKHEVDCPSINAIFANATFVRADELTDGIWFMRSNHFQIDNQAWDIIFGVHLPDAQTKKDALNLGQLYFSQHVVLNDPKKVVEDPYTSCTYAENDDYMVMAVNPPVNFPSLTASFASRLHQ